jgi:haloacetate dehalogenase
MADPVIDLFPGFSTQRIATPAGEIFARIGGSGPPLLLLHGYPETHAMWHRLAPKLAPHFTVVAADLRGYGRSFIAPTLAGHESYSKRVMAADMVAVMAGLGFKAFSVVGHDRGARVTYRMMLDHPAVVTSGVLLDIMTTADLWETINRRQIMRMYHWPFLAQAAPLPERMIAGDPRGFLESRFQRGDAILPAWLEPAVLEDYWSAFSNPARVHATCEDYRAGATCDVVHDEADRAVGHTITSPLLVIWGTRGNLAETADPLDLWRRWCPHVSGQAVESGHFIPEEHPGAIITTVLPFLLNDGSRGGSSV